MADKQQFFTFQIDGVSAELGVVGFRGSEGISELFEFEVDFVSEDATIDFDAAVGKPAVLEMRTNDDPRYVHGIVSSIEETGVGLEFTNYCATVVPALWTFGLRSDCCIYQALNVPDVIKDILQSGGLESGSDFVLRLKGSYPKLEYCVQYRETDLEFVLRLMEEVGIFYFFEHAADGHKLVLADDRGEHADIQGPAVLPFRPVDTGLQSDAEEVTGLCFTRTLRTGTVAMRSFNFEKTALTLETTSKASADTQYVDYDFDGRYVSEGAGKDLAKIKQESYGVTRRTLSGSSNCRHFTAGYRFAVSEHPRDEFNADFVLVRVRHTGRQPQAAGTDVAEADEDVKVYVNDFEAIPADVTFRPPHVTERGLVEGPQTATVTGPSGEEIYCDAHGRVKVRFHWDRYGKADDTASVWIRVGQSHRVGDLAIPRVGEEVIVDFLEGDPDQPIITGRVYNGTKQSPYALPGDKTKSSFKTYSSPGGGGYNELRFEDASGSEEVFIHAQKDWNIQVEHDRTQTVGHDAESTIGNDERIEDKRDRALKVGRDELIDIVKDQTISVGGNLSEKIGKNETVEIGGNQTLTVGGDESVTVKGGRTTSIGKDESITVGGSHSETVEKDQTIEVGKDRSDTIKKNLSLSIKKNSSIDIGKDASESVAGNSEETVKKKKKIDVGEELTIVCGSAKITLKKDGSIKIEGSKIEMKSDGPVKIKGSAIEGN